MRKYTNILLLFCFFTLSNSWGQVDTLPSSKSFFSIDERKLVETKWKYTYAIHLESNTIIHQAESFYDYFLYFRYDYSFQQYLNGEFTRGRWLLDGNELAYQFKHINGFEIVVLNKQTMVLEFNQTNSKGTYQYHFIRVDSKDAPFVKPAYELPDVIVETTNPKKRNGWLSLKKKKKRKKKKKKGKEKPIHFSIELIGGGYYGGLNPVLRDYIHIKSDGRLIKEFKSANTDLVVTRKNIPRDELLKFAEYIVEQKFFEFDRQYDCGDSYCQGRKREKPRPIPLRLAIAYGNKKKVVTVSIWGEDNEQIRYVNYPPALDYIIDAIHKMAVRI